MKLRDQWDAVERRLPSDWETVTLRLRTEEAAELPEAARILGPMGVGHVGDHLVVTVRRAGGAAGPQAARRLFARLDEGRVWSLLEQDAVDVAEPAAATPESEAATPASGSVAAGWDAALAELPTDWSDLLCFLELDSSALLPRAALLCAPINPARDKTRNGFTFRAAQRAGYGVSPAMARRCFERLDDEGIPARATVLRLLSDVDHVATQGAVWYVGGKVL
ncbi:MAG TPA: hypothetical protein VFQ28_04605 [Gaiella sp.]|nr:hypothetical protein [Gaiella sp.]